MALDSASYPFIAIDSASAARASEPPDGWMGAVISAADDAERALSLIHI